MKKVLIILLLILLCGCTSNYDLEISNDSFKESINAYIDKEEIPRHTQDDIELDDQITPFLENKYSALFSKKDSFYKKDVTELDNGYIVDMNYKYKASEFNDSNSLKLCFSNYNFSSKKNYYIHAYGEFLCLYSDDININIKTNNKVIKHNADSVNGNIYTWNINRNNVNNVDIEFEVDKGISQTTMIYSIVGGLLLLIAIILTLIVIYKKKKENKI